MLFPFVCALPVQPLSAVLLALVENAVLTLLIRKLLFQKPLFRKFLYQKLLYQKFLYQKFLYQIVLQSVLFPFINLHFPCPPAGRNLFCLRQIFFDFCSGAHQTIFYGALRRIHQFRNFLDMVPFYIIECDRETDFFRQAAECIVQL